MAAIISVGELPSRMTARHNSDSTSIQEVAQILATGILRLKRQEQDGQRKAVSNAGAAVAAQNSAISK